jgi:hypothetical protein
MWKWRIENCLVSLEVDMFTDVQDTTSLSRPLSILGALVDIQAVLAGLSCEGVEFFFVDSATVQSIS